MEEACQLEDDAAGLLDPVVAPESESPLGQNADQLNDLSNLQLDLFTDMNFDADFDMETSPLWAGEGLDFIPLPAIDPEISQATGGLEAPGFSLEWPQQTNPPDQTHTETTMEDTNVPPSITEDNRRLIQHYLEVMNGYSKVTDHDNTSNNLFIAAFSKSLFFAPLFYAILAFSASHMALQDASLTEAARRYDTLAEQTFNQFNQDHKAEVEGLLSALFVRVKKVHVMGESVDAFLNLISTATDIISTDLGRQALEDPSGLSRRIVLRLAILDARASCYRLGGGALVRRLREIPALSFVFDRDDKEVSSAGTFIHLLRAAILRMRVGELDVRLHQQTDGSQAVLMGEVESIEADIKTGVDRWENRLAVHDGETRPDKCVLNATLYGCYTVLSALHSALLYLYSIYPLASADTSLSATKILHCQLTIHQDTSRTASPSSILPSSLFMAGIFTDDVIHRDWVRMVFKEGEEWGLHVTKARELLEAVYRMRRPGNSVDIGGVMDAVTGRFII
ncbi:hypothetical protein ACJ41O_014826 [Fusarium nematophilum]